MGDVEKILNIRRTQSIVEQRQCGHSRYTTLITGNSFRVFKSYVWSDFRVFRVPIELLLQTVLFGVCRFGFILW